jgi:hypothetical protein
VERRTTTATEAGRKRTVSATKAGRKRTTTEVGRKRIARATRADRKRTTTDAGRKITARLTGAGGKDSCQHQRIEQHQSSILLDNRKCCITEDSSHQLVKTYYSNPT